MSGLSRLSTVAITAAVALIVGSCGQSESSAGSRAGSPAGAEATEAHWEAVALAGAAEVIVDEDGDLLRLEGIDPDLATFTDRPERLAGSLTMHEFLSLWSSGVFRDDPPNAALVRGDEVVSVELLGAVYDPATDELWFAIDPLEPTPGDAAKRLADLVGPPAGPAQLFIDGFPSPVDTQVTDAVTQTNVKVVWRGTGSEHGPRVSVNGPIDESGSAHNDGAVG